MKSRYLGHVFLLLLIIGLYSFNYYQSRKSATLPIQTIVPTLMPEQVNDIIITRPGHVPIHLQKNTRWDIVAPFQAHANPARIQLILSLLTTPVQRSFEAPEDLKKFGLDPAVVTLTLNHIPLNFGNPEPLSHTRYIQYQHQIYLLNTPFMPMLQASATSFIDNRLIEKDRHIDAIEFPSQPGKTFRPLIQLHQGHWKSNIANLSQDTLITLIQNWQHAYAIKVDPLAGPDLANLTDLPTIRITFQEKHAPLELKVQIKPNSLILINPASRLRYLFPIHMKQTLFFKKTEKADA